MTTPDIPTEALEAAARAIAARAHSKRHGQLCPCWTKGAPIGECNCWILTRARGDAAAAAPHLIAEGRVKARHRVVAGQRERRQAVDQQRDDLWVLARHHFACLPPDEDATWRRATEAFLTDVFSGGIDG